MATPKFPCRHAFCASLGAVRVVRLLRGVGHLRPSGPVDGGHSRFVSDASVGGAAFLGMAAFAIAVRPLLAAIDRASGGRRLRRRHLVHGLRQVTGKFRLELSPRIFLSHFLLFLSALK